MAVALGAFVLFATPLIVRPNVSMGLGGSLLGYLLPGIVLARLAKKRQHKIQLGLADALDLMVVSVEAGLGLDQAILRVGDELMFAHPDLADELRLVNIELRAGKARTDALRNLADRTGLDDLVSLTTMLIQTDKFGTERRPVAAGVFRDPADQAAPAGRGSRGQDRREDGVSAGLLHLPGDLGRGHRACGDQVRAGDFPNRPEHQAALTRPTRFRNHRDA